MHVRVDAGRRTDDALRIGQSVARVGRCWTADGGRYALHIRRASSRWRCVRTTVRGLCERRAEARARDADQNSNDEKRLTQLKPPVGARSILHALKGNP